MDRTQLLTSWARHLADAARSGALTGRPVGLARVETIAGPRAGALEIFAGLDSGRLLRELSKNDAAILRQFIPWQFVGDPQVFMSGRYVRCEAGWPVEVAESVIRLADLCKKPVGGGRWVAGRSESGATVVPGLTDQTAHFLFSGATGSGKSVALRSAILQLSADPDNEIILADGKMGESLRQVERLPGILGPCAVEGPTIRAALGLAVRQMTERYRAGYHTKRLVVVYDEFQEQREDQVITDLLRKLAAQGRGAGVHLLAATQHPTVDSFGDSSTRRNMSGKVALRVGDADASRVAVGGASPRADYLLGAGDSYTIGPGACHRVQLVYIDEADITRAEHGGPDWRYPAWPEYEPEALGDLDNAVGWSYTGAELAVSLVSAAHGDGRPTLCNRLTDAGFPRPGSDRAARLLQLGRDAHDWLERNDYALMQETACLSDGTQTGAVVGAGAADVW